MWTGVEGHDRYGCTAVQVKIYASETFMLGSRKPLNSRTDNSLLLARLLIGPVAKFSIGSLRVSGCQGQIYI